MLNPSHERKMQDAPTQYVVYEHYLLEDSPEPTRTRKGRTFLKPRQMLVIALAGLSGAGLMNGIGTELSRGGPLGMLLGYIFVGAICWCVMIRLGEMCTFLLHKRGFAGYAARFWHPAAGFAMGWSYAFVWLLWIPSQIQAANVRFYCWNPNIQLHYWAWPFIFGIIYIGSLGVCVFGEAEFSFKVLTLVGFILFGLIIDLGGNPAQEVKISFWLAEANDKVCNTDLSRFVGLGSVLGFFLVGAMNAYIGTC